MRILIAHAREPLRQEIRRSLEPLDADVREAASARAALRELTAWEPDVALVDVELCGPDGAGLLGEFKAHARSWGTAVVLLAADVEPGEALEQLRRGAHDYLVEPVRPGEVIARVDAAVRAKRLQEELLAHSQRVEAQLLEDDLTGVHNRRFTLAQLGALLSAARRHARPLSVLMIDIDDFKRVNDTHGHAAGDRVLSAVARRIRARLRAEDHVGRIGGEEFLVLLPDAGVAEAARVAEAVRECVSEVSVHVRGEGIRVTISVGWSTFSADRPDETPEALLRRADMALYAAKADGRDAVRAG